MAVYFLSYKGTHAGLAGVVNRGIRLLDHAPYSHTELCLGHPLEGEVPCYSSAGVDGGVRQKDMLINPAKWDAMHLPWVQDEQVLDFFEKTKNAGYDYWGTGRFALPFLLREHPELFFCTEWCLAALGVESAWRFSPSGGEALCHAMGGVRLNLHY